MDLLAALIANANQDAAAFRYVRRRDAPENKSEMDFLVGLTPIAYRESVRSESVFRKV